MFRGKASIFATIIIPLSALKTYALPILFLGGIGVENGFECWSSEMEIGIVKWEKRVEDSLN